MPYSTRCTVGMRDVETVIERIIACLRMEASAGTICTASWRGTVGLRCFDMGSSSRLCCKMGECLLRGRSLLPMRPCARVDHKGQGMLALAGY